MNEAFRVVVPQLGEAGTGLHQYVHNGEVRLQRLGIQAGKFNSSEHGTGHEEICGRAPVTLNVHIRSLVGLASLDVESDGGTVAPVLGLGEFLPAFHIAPDFHAECLHHVHCNEEVRDAFRIVQLNDGVPFEKRQCHQQSGDDLGAADA